MLGAMQLYRFSPGRVALSKDWLQPDWPAPAHVHALHTSRSGGVSQSPYAHMNLGSHVGDRAECVQQNRERLAAASGARPVFLEQIHGSFVCDLDRISPQPAPQADGACTQQEGSACCVLVADCLAVLLCDTSGTVVAALHAGWRGLLGQSGDGVLEAGVAALRQRAGRAAEILAWLGPCIGPRVFEVGSEVRDAFVQQSAANAACFTPGLPGKWFADLAALARLRLRAAGVQALYGNDGSADWCSVTQASRFFSYRRDRVSGRMAACIWMQR